MSVELGGSPLIPHILDPHNGFERVYHSVRKNMEYSVVVVPSSQKFFMEYTKPVAGIDLLLQALDSYYWTVEGMLEADSFADFGLINPNSRKMDPASWLNITELAACRQFGSISESGQINREGLSLYSASLELPPLYVFNFLRSVWRPSENRAYSNHGVPAIKVGIYKGEDRLLPQKYHHRYRGQRGELRVKNPLMTHTQ